jgi:hypothetical protein
MTGKRIAITAAAALTVAALAIAVRPLLSNPHRAPAAAPTVAASEPSGLATIAIVAARTDLRCPGRPSRQHPATGCGSLHITRHQTHCTTASRCTIELVGDLETSDLDVPVALTIPTVRDGSTWHVIEVAS